VAVRRFLPQPLGPCLHKEQRGGKTPRGHQTPQKKSDTLVMGGWVRGQKGNMVKYFPPKYFYGVFELPLPRNAQKRDKTIEKNPALDFGRFFCKTNSTWIFGKKFCMVCLNSPQQKTPRNAKKQQKKPRKNTYRIFCLFFVKSFRQQVQN
jgi:hypothetical protein